MDNPYAGGVGMSMGMGAQVRSGLEVAWCHQSGVGVL
jgi:hypothetical protein